jgi:hypothetical protein
MKQANYNKFGMGITEICLVDLFHPFIHFFFSWLLFTKYSKIGLLIYRKLL